MKYLILLAICINAIYCEVYFKDYFESGSKLRHLTIIHIKLIKITFVDKWEEKWIYSKHPGIEYGKVVLTSGKIFNDVEADKGKNQFELEPLIDY